MQTLRTGNASEAAVLSAFARRRFNVLVPFGEGHPYDLVVAIDDAFLRVQCKTGWAGRGCVLFNAYATDHGRGQRSYVGRVDIFGVYFPPSEAVYLVPVDLFVSEGRLRLEPTRNNQRRRVRFAAQYEINTWTAPALRELATARSSSSGSRRLDPHAANCGLPFAPA